MKVPPLFFGCLLVAFGKHAVLAQYPNWQQNLANIQSMQKNPMVNVGQILQEAHQIEQKAAALQNQVHSQLQDLKQKCARKGLNNAISEPRLGTSNLIHQFVNGIIHIYEQTVDPATNKVDGRYYSIDSKNPNAEPVCGHLTIN